MPLVEHIEKKLGGWKGKFISKGGRLQLVKSVLSSIPIYHMMCFRLPQWVIMRIDKVRWQLLWGKPIDLKQGISSQIGRSHALQLLGWARSLQSKFG